MPDPMRLFFMNDTSGLKELPIGAAASPNTLPSTFIVAPGIYTALGYQIDARNEGLYSLSDFFTSVQFISYASNLNALKVAVANLTQHGNTDDGITIPQMMARVSYRTIERTCGGAAPLANNIFGSLAGIPSRIVNLYTMGALNSYDNGHTLVEIKIGGTWRLFDADMKYEFIAADGVTPHNLVTLSDALAAGQHVNFIPLSDQPGSCGSLFNFLWVVKAARQSPATWYSRMAGICSINGYALCDSAPQSTRAAYFSQLPMSRATFMATYYP